MANPMPAAEADVTADLVRRLLAGQHPDLAHLPVEFLANGWDNVMFRVGAGLTPACRAARWALRSWCMSSAGSRCSPRGFLSPFPIQNGSGILPMVTPGLEASCRTCGGRSPPPRTGWTCRWRRTRSPGSSARCTFPRRRTRRPTRSAAVPLADRAENLGKNLDMLAGKVDRAAVLGVWEDALAAPVFAGPRVWLHGDLHPA